MTLLLALLLLADGSTKAAGKKQPPMTAEQVFAARSPITVVVKVYRKGEPLGTGSGVITGTNEVTTCHHVIEKADEIRVVSRGRVLEASRRAINKKEDLALLTVLDLPASKPAPIRASSELRPGEPVFAIGAPKGLELTISDGIVSGVREMNGQTLVQASAPISPGSSGGGLFDNQGNLVGIADLVRVGEGVQALNFWIPAEFITQLRVTTAARAACQDGADLKDCLDQCRADAYACGPLFERAVRDPSHAAGAVGLLEKHCDQDDPAACFALSAVFEESDSHRERVEPILKDGCDRLKHGPSCIRLAEWARGAGNGAEADRLFERGCTIAKGSEQTAACGRAAMAYSSLDAVKADNFYEKACDADAAYTERASSCLRVGASLATGTARREKRALELLTVSCAGESAEACHRLGVLLTNADDTSLRDTQSARVSFERGCQLGYQRSCEYARGNVSELDCYAGDFKACINAGSVHFTAKPPDYVKARKFFGIACNGQIANGCWFLGAMHLDGKGGGKDLNEAVRLLGEGCRQDSAGACVALADIYYKTNWNAALRYLNKACGLGDKDSCQIVNTQASFERCLARCRQVEAQCSSQCFGNMYCRNDCLRGSTYCVQACQ